LGALPSWLLAAGLAGLPAGAVDPRPGPYRWTTADGRTILTDVAVVAASFAWMSLSQVPANGRLGVLVALALGLSGLFTLLGLPAGMSRKT
jgi:hypothetical protein